MLQVIDHFYKYPRGRSSKAYSGTFHYRRARLPAALAAEALLRKFNNESLSGLPSATTCAKLGRGQKYADYLLLREIVILMNQKEHLTKEGLEKSIANKASMNKGISDILQAAFPNVIPTPRPKVVNKKIMHPY